MRRWLCSVRPSSKRVRMCLPRATTSATVRPRRSAVASAGTRRSKRVTSRPASAWCRRWAVSQTVSPSGIRSADLSRTAGFGLRGRAPALPVRALVRLSTTAQQVTDLRALGLDGQRHAHQRPHRPRPGSPEISCVGLGVVLYGSRRSGPQPGAQKAEVSLRTCWPDFGTAHSTSCCAPDVTVGRRTPTAMLNVRRHVLVAVAADRSCDDVAETRRVRGPARSRCRTRACPGNTSSTSVGAGDRVSAAVGRRRRSAGTGPGTRGSSPAHLVCRSMVLVGAERHARVAVEAARLVRPARAAWLVIARLVEAALEPHRRALGAGDEHRRVRAVEVDVGDAWQHGRVRGRVAAGGARRDARPVRQDRCATPAAGRCGSPRRAQ